MDIREVLREIKPYEALGMRAENDAGGEIAIRIPLEKNLNDKGTMFAGSIYSAMVLCGWSRAYRTLNGESKKYDVVIRRSEIDYRLPVRSDAIAAAELSGNPVVKPNGNVSVPVTVRVRDESNTLCAEFTGEYIGIEMV